MLKKCKKIKDRRGVKKPKAGASPEIRKIKNIRF